MEVLVFVLPVCAAMVMNKLDSMGWAAHSRNNDSCPPHSWSMNILTNRLECQQCLFVSSNTINNSNYD